ncbi:hypothetical protein CLOP_g9654 [Closterium sp. NIES-67]|nr:hypothetical protein CLOP_g9654 [Closterium sp. NIES-67]
MHRRKPVASLVSHVIAAASRQNYQRGCGGDSAPLRRLVSGSNHAESSIQPRREGSGLATAVGSGSSLGAGSVRGLLEDARAGSGARSVSGSDADFRSGDVAGSATGSGVRSSAASAAGSAWGLRSAAGGSVRRRYARAGVVSYLPGKGGRSYGSINGLAGSAAWNAAGSAASSVAESGGAMAGVEVRRVNAATGLFGYEELSEPKGFHRMAADAIARTEALLREVAAAPPSLRTVCLLDEMSDNLCRVLDAAELCRNVHPNREFVEAANEAFVKLSTYVQALNSNQQLYRLLVAAIQAMPPAASTSPSSLPPAGKSQQSQQQGAGRAGGGEREEVLREAHRVAQLLRLDFERGGVHLPDDRREEVQRLTGEITRTSIEFNANIHSDSSSIEVFPRSSLHALPPNVHAMLQPIQRSKATSTSGSSSSSRSSSDGGRSSGSFNSDAVTGGSFADNSAGSCTDTSRPGPGATASSSSNDGEGAECREKVGNGGNASCSSSSSSSSSSGSGGGGSSSGTNSGAPKDLGYRVFSDPLVTSSVLKWVDDEEVRRRVYVLANASPGSNLHQLDRLIDLRSQLAKELSFPSYAHLINVPLMAKTPDTVNSFLHNLGAQLTPKVFQELQQLGALKRQHRGERDASRDGGSGNEPSVLHAWDRSFYSGLAKARRFHLDSRVISSYFPLHACVRGMALLVKSLFNVHLEPVPTSPGEVWAPDVTKYSLTHPVQGPLGFIYLDLHPRRGKFSHAAHFTIRCGRRKQLPLDRKGHLLPLSVPSHNSSSDDYQLPVSWAVLRWAVLRWAVLRWAVLRWAVLRWAVLRWAVLRWAVLR